MAKLTEQEITIESGLFAAKIYAEFRNDETDSIFIELSIDGCPVTWALNHRYGQICILHAGELQRDWERLNALIAPEFAKILQKEISKLIS